MLYLSREDVASLLSYEICIEACEDALRLQGTGEAEEVPRFRFTLENNFWLAMMPSMIRSRGIVGLRIYGGTPLRIMYLLWDARDGRQLCMMDAMVIRDVRTGSVGAIGAKHMSRPNSQSVAVIGSGQQARAALAAHTRVRKFKNATVFSPNKEHREAFARTLGDELNLNIEPVDSPEEAVKDADIIITGTSANAAGTPTFFGSWMRPGVHVSSIGGRAELDDEAVTRADRVIIDSKAQFPHEARDVTSQVEKGLITWDQIAELHEVVAGDKKGRESDQEITLLKTVGTPLQDLLPAAKVYTLAVEREVGTNLGDVFPPAVSWLKQIEEVPS
jgi:ornithine cyclodeaminase/alanine dehydrogenase-like protein (mu-crystallin family)